MSKKAEITDIISVIILPLSITESRKRRISSQLMKCQSTITFIIKVLCLYFPKSSIVLNG